MDQNDTLKLYNEALDRLIKNVSINVDKGTKITNDAVSLEAGRGKGSIKKSRPGYADLIARIDAAAEEQRKPKREVEDLKHRLKSQIKDLEGKLDAALAREMSLVYELLAVRRQVAKLTGEKVIPMRRKTSLVTKTIDK